MNKRKFIKLSIFGSLLYSIFPYKISLAETKKIINQNLTEAQKKIMFEEATERPFSSPLNQEKREGFYHCANCGAKLFQSNSKFDSGTGWPSFSQPIKNVELVEKVDRKLFGVRTEVRSPIADSHLGHVFPDGPEPTGLRYCMNSAALRFIPVNDLESEGYGEYVDLFD